MSLKPLNLRKPRRLNAVLSKRLRGKRNYAGSLDEIIDAERR